MPGSHSADILQILMSVIDDFPDVLQNLEAVVLEASREHPEMSDYTALSAYQAAFQHYREEMRGHAPKPSALRGLDNEVFERVKSICEYRLGRGPGPKDISEKITPIPVDKLVDCLRKLVESVELHTSMEGRRGYLTFIAQFV